MTNPQKEKGGYRYTAQNKTTTANFNTSLEQIAPALTFIDAHDRDTWLKVGMAVKSALGEAGFDCWDNWSSTADNYKARHALAVWKSFKESGGVNIGSLFYLAQQNGYTGQGGESYTPTAEELAQREARQRADMQAQAQRRIDAASKAHAIWNKPANAWEATQPAIGEHPYLKRKGVLAYGLKVFRGTLTIGGMDCNGALMLPISLDGKVCSLQFINGEGEKRFLAGGEKGGFLIGRIAQGKPVCICEGYATGATIHEATGYPVVIAFDAGNLKKMALRLRSNKPDIEIILCADLDESGTGQRKATEAAQAVGGKVVLPNFASGVCRE